MNVKVVREHNFIGRTHKLWVYRPRGYGEAEILRLTPEPNWEIIPAQAPPGEPTLELPEDVLEAIVAEGSSILPPDAAQANHLKDAIEVRNRLLTIVEQR